jgi:predicted nucleotidyltransferase
MNKSSGKCHNIDFVVIPIFTKNMPYNQDGENIPRLSAVMDILRSALPNLHLKYKVRQVGIVGSFARNEQKSGSDIDLMVDLYEPIGWDVVDLKEYLESLLHIPVDLVLKGGVINRPRLYAAMTQDVIYVTA